MKSTLIGRGVHSYEKKNKLILKFQIKKSYAKDSRKKCKNFNYSKFYLSAASEQSLFLKKKIKKMIKDFDSCQQEQRIISKRVPLSSAQTPSVQHIGSRTTPFHHPKSLTSTPKGVFGVELRGFWCRTEWCVELRGFGCGTERFLGLK